MDPKREKLTGLALVVGAILTICGCLSTLIFGMGGVFRATYTRTPVSNEITDLGPMAWIPSSIGWTAVGMFMLGGAVLYMGWYDRQSRKGPRQVIENARVLSRYGISKTGDMLNSSWEFEFADSPRYFVRLQTSPRDTAEYECDAPVFWQCGEGMYGEAEVQRRWLGRFTPYIGTPQASNVNDPFVT